MVPLFGAVLRSTTALFLVHFTTQHSSLLHSHPSLVVPAEAASAPCDCNFGVPVKTTPYCQCNCEGMYMGPKCLYRPEDLGIRVDVWFNCTEEEFVSRRMVKILSEKLETTFKFERAYTGTYGSTVWATFSTQGAGVYNLLALYAKSPRPPWMSELKIIDVFDASLDKIAGVSRSDVGRTYLGYDDTNIFAYEGLQLSLSAFIYLVLCGLIVVLMWVCEFCCFSNTMSDINNDIRVSKLKMHSTYGSKAAAAAREKDDVFAKPASAQRSEVFVKPASPSRGARVN